MTEKEYRSHPAISRSDLWKIRESPEKFRWYMDNPPEPTPALLFGQVVHKMLLQPKEFFESFSIAPPFDRRTKQGKEEWGLFEDAVAEQGLTVIKEDMYTQAKDMVSKAMQEPFVAKLLSGEHEKEYFWTDELTGEECKCRVDCITQIAGQNIVIDYKTCNDASTDGFMRDAIRYGYDFQSAMYLDGTKADRFVFIVQEKQPPYAVNILEADKPFIEHGYDLFREYIGTYHYCKQTNNWYGFLGKEGIINSLSIPVWLAKGDNA